MRTSELLWRGLRDQAREHGWLQALRTLSANVRDVLRDSFPDRRRMRYGDIQYDLDHGVNTTWANVGFRTRLREAFIGADYQATDPLVIPEVMDLLQARVDLSQFTFIDIGSGKGRVLLMASEYPFRRIIGVEIMPELQKIARDNTARDARIELLLSDAREFVFPEQPLLVFLFNPFPAWVLRDVMRNLQRSIEASPRPVYVVLHNPENEWYLASVPTLKKIAGTPQFVMYVAAEQG